MLLRSQGKQWIRIKNETFYTNELYTQLNLDGGAVIDITIDNCNTSHYEYFYEMIPSQKRLDLNKNLKFDMLSHLFRACGCLITHLDFDLNKKKLKLKLICDYIYNKDLNERREEVLNEIFKNIENKKNNNS